MSIEHFINPEKIQESQRLKGTLCFFSILLNEIYICNFQDSCIYINNIFLYINNNINNILI